MPNAMESKKVSITIQTEQKLGDQREIEQSNVCGDLYFKEESTHLLYQEGNIKTHIRISGDTVHVHRLGDLSGDLWFVEGDERDTRYETPYGRMMLTVKTHRIRWDVKTLTLNIRYNILTDGQVVSMNEMSIKMKEIKEA